MKSSKRILLYSLLKGFLRFGLKENVLQKSPFQQVLCQSPQGPIFISSRTRTQSKTLCNSTFFPLSIESNISGGFSLASMPTELPTVSYKGKEGEEANVKQPVAHDNEFICSLFPLDIGHLATTFFGQSSLEDTFLESSLAI